MTQRKKAELVLLATTVIWGGTFVVMKLGFADVTPFLFVAIRFTLGAMIFGAIFFRRLRSIKSAALWKGAILGGIARDRSHPANMRPRNYHRFEIRVSSQA